MINTYDFLKSIIDAMTEHIVVINKEGDIIFVNKSWIQFGLENNILINNNWEKINYLEVCDKSTSMGDNFGKKASEGIRNVINSKQSSFYFEYPCHSPNQKRWFMMIVTPFKINETNYFVISHQNITERKLDEERVLSLSNIDGLTSIANRRRFDEFLNDEWNRCLRLKMPITLAVLDLDHFKLLNDTYGHQTGDNCLRKVGQVIKQFTRRPSDICARYGGEEFAIVFGDITLEKTIRIIEELIIAIKKLNIPNVNSPTKQILTVSIGLATMYPDNKNNQKDLFEAADKQLYRAKKNGRNQFLY